MLLLRKWDNRIKPDGYWIQEKLDGHRAYWDGAKFISRAGNVINCPKWFSDGFPNEALDGELWAGRGGFEKVSSVIGSLKGNWELITYGVFDSPDFDGLYEERYEHAKEILNGNPRAFVIDKFKCEGTSHLLSELDKIVSLGGEGLVLRKPKSKYERKRSFTCLKVKKIFTDKAVVIEHVEKNRPGLTGSLRVIRKDGVIFDVGSGITERMAHNPPQIGTIIEYSFKQVSANGKPKSAAFVRIIKGV